MIPVLPRGTTSSPPRLALGRSLSGPRGTVRRRAARAARAQPRRCADGHAGASAASYRCTRGSTTTRPCCSRPIGRAPANSRAAAARVPAAEWLLDNYHLVEEQVREVRDAPAGRLLPAAAEARRRTVRRLPARVRHRLGVRRPHRQPLRSRDPAALHRRVPDGPAADDRRVVGGRHHAAHRADREPAAPRRPDHGRARANAHEAEHARRPAARLGQPRSRALDARHRAHARRRTCPEIFAASSPNACATRTRRRRPRSAGSRSASRRRAPRSTMRSCSTRISGRPCRTSRCATSSPACGCISDIALVRAVRARQPRRRAAARSAAISPRWISRRATLYRSAIEQLSRGSRSRARSTSRCAHSTPPRRHGPRESVAVEAARLGDPGYHLIGGGRPRASNTRSASARRSACGSSASRSASASAATSRRSCRRRPRCWRSRARCCGPRRLDDAAIVAFVALAFVPFSDAATALVNRVMAIYIERDRAAGLELDDGVAAALRTLVVVPTLLTSAAELLRADRTSRGPLPRPAPPANCTSRC